MSLHWLFLEPLDALLLRGNQLFGDAGSYGQSLMPPWPSVAAGAIRSRILVDEGIPLDEFAAGKHLHGALGTPQQPGTFTLCALHLAQRKGESAELLLPAPADLFIPQEGEPQLLRPAPLPAGLVASSPLPQLPMLALEKRSKPAAAQWLTAAGWQKYLRGQTPARSDMLPSGDIWSTDERTGVGLDAATRSAKDGRLFVNSAIVMHKDVGFAAAVAGIDAVPTDGLLRFGGDGRAVAVHHLPIAIPQPDWDAIAAQKRCRLILASPGVFTHGWLPNGFTREGDAWRFAMHGVRARLVAAAVPRHATISGWDLARHQPKDAQRIAPTGSVYWLDELDATPDALRQLADAGLWSTPCEDDARRAEGFNRLHIAQWNEKSEKQEH